MADESTPGNRLTIRSSRCHLKVRQFSLGNTWVRAGIVPEEPPPDRCPDDTEGSHRHERNSPGERDDQNRNDHGGDGIPEPGSGVCYALGPAPGGRRRPARHGTCCGWKRRTSPKPSRRRIRKRLPRPPARPVAIVVTATINPLQNSVRRGPKRSAIQPPKIWRRCTGMRKRRMPDRSPRWRGANRTECA